MKCLILVLVCFPLAVLPGPASAEADEAAILFGQAQDVFEGFVRLRITSSKPPDLKKQMTRKITESKKVEAAFRKVIDRKNPAWTVAAVFMLGRVYADMATTFLEIPAPKTFTPEQKDLFIEALGTMAEPYEQKAIQHFETVVDRAPKFDATRHYAEKARSRLEKIRTAMTARRMRRQQKTKASEKPADSRPGVPEQD